VFFTHLEEKLQSFRFPGKAFFASEDIQTRTAMETKLTDALRASRVLCSPNYFKSVWSGREREVFGNASRRINWVRRRT